ncbi:MAG: alpha/beta hydrolase [Tissierellia bacterium]|nr:alpha/beta hydrolase [Tissierellia bacterium]
MKDYAINYMDLANGERLAYRKAGDRGKTLLLIHGNLSSSIHYQILMNRLERDYRIYAPDMRGFGHSSYENPISSLRDLAMDIKEFVLKLDLKDIYVVGWSTGGGVAMELATMIPERIKKIFLQSSVSVEGFSIYKKNKYLNFPISDSMYPLGDRIYKKIDLEKDQFFVKPVLDAINKTNKRYIKLIWDYQIYRENKPDKEEYDRYLDEILLQRNLVDIYHALTTFNITHADNGVVAGNGRIDLIKAPVVILHGDKDKVIELESAEISKKHFGNRAQLVIFEGAGHSIFTDDMDGYCKQLLSRIV